MIVNNALQVNIGEKFEAEAIRVLRRIPEVTVSLTRGRPGRADAVVTYGATETPIKVEFKRRVSSASAYLITQQAGELKDPLVVIASDMTGKAREVLTEAGIGSVDGLGNVRLELPGLLMRITGTKPARRSAPPTRLSGKSAVIAQAMLLDVKRSWHVSDLASLCGVSTALVHRVLKRLESEGVLDVRGAGPSKVRRLSNSPALLDLWAEEHRDRLSRQPLFKLAQTTDLLIRSLCDGLEKAEVEYALTGSAAAAYVAPFVTDIPLTEVWLPSAVDVSRVGAELGATPVEAGANVVLLQERDDGPLAFRTRHDDLWMVNIFRLYVDLSRDPRRGVEQGDYLRREVIGF